MSMRVALFVTCLVDTLRPEVGKATVAVFERQGVRVEFPEEQTCCGQLHHNADELEDTSRSGAEGVCACDTSCLLHIGGGFERAGSPVRAVHLAEILAG